MTSYSGIENLEIMAEAVNYNRFLLNLVTAGLDRRQKVLDFGAGTGTFAERVAGLGFEIVCVESDPGLRERLQYLGLRSSEELRTISGCSVDFAYSLNVLEHLKEEGPALAELFRVLKPGGRLLIYVPAFPMLFSSMDKAVGHYRRYKRHDLSAVVERVGFQIDTVAYADSLGFFATLMFKLLDSGSGRINRQMLKTYDRFFFPVSRALDSALCHFFGKNLILLARRP